MGKSLVKFIGFCEGCDQNGVSVSKNDKSCCIYTKWQKMIFVSYEKYETLYIYI